MSGTLLAVDDRRMEERRWASRNATRSAGVVNTGRGRVVVVVGGEPLSTSGPRLSMRLSISSSFLYGESMGVVTTDVTPSDTRDVFDLFDTPLGGVVMDKKEGGAPAAAPPPPPPPRPMSMSTWGDGEPVWMGLRRSPGLSGTCGVAFAACVTPASPPPSGPASPVAVTVAVAVDVAVAVAVPVPVPVPVPVAAEGGLLTSAASRAAAHRSRLDEIWAKQGSMFTPGTLANDWYSGWTTPFVNPAWVGGKSWEGHEDEPVCDCWDGGCETNHNNRHENTHTHTHTHNRPNTSNTQAAHHTTPHHTTPHPR